MESLRNWGICSGGKYSNSLRKIDKFTNLEQAKNYLIESERTKMLNMYSLTHYDNLMRSLTVNYHKWQKQLL